MFARLCLLAVCGLSFGCRTYDQYPLEVATPSPSMTYAQPQPAPTLIYAQPAPTVQQAPIIQIPAPPPPQELPQAPPAQLKAPKPSTQDGPGVLPPMDAKPMPTPLKASIGAPIPERDTIWVPVK